MDRLSSKYWVFRWFPLVMFNSNTIDIGVKVLRDRVSGGRSRSIGVTCEWSRGAISDCGLVSQYFPSLKTTAKVVRIMRIGRVHVLYLVSRVVTGFFLRAAFQNVRDRGNLKVAGLTLWRAELIPTLLGKKKPVG